MNEPWIYLVLLGGVIAVFGWLRPERASNESMKVESFQTNMEETLEHYIQEVAAENDKLLNVIERMKQEQDTRNEAARRRMDKLDSAIHILDDKLELWKSNAVSAPGAAISHSVSQEQWNQTLGQVPEPAMEYEVPVPPRSSIRNRYPELFELLAAGTSPDEAAQLLSLPLGEIQLIIQLAEQEDHRV